MATNEFLIGIALQTAEGTPASAPQYRVPVTAADLRPQVTTGTRERTGLTRDGGEVLVTGRQVTGGWTMILTAMTAPLFYYAVMGAKSSVLKDPAWAASTAYSAGAYIADGAGPYAFEATTAGTTGTTEPAWPATEGATVTDGTVVWTNRGLARRTHTATPAPDQPWVTLWRFWNREVYERFTDCKLISHSTTGGAEQNNGDMVGQFGAVGKNYEYLTGLGYDPYDPAASGAGTFDNSDVLRWFGCTTLINGTADGNVDEMTHGVEANQNANRTQSLSYSRIEPGMRQSTLTFQKIYDNDADYRRAAYGSATATAPTDEVAVASWESTFRDQGGAERMKIEIPRLGYTEDPTLPVSTSAETARVGFGGGVQRPTTGDILTYTFTNQVASYSA